MAVSGRSAQNGERAAFARADLRKRPQILRPDRKHVALLRLVAPDLARRHAAVLRRRRPQLEPRAAPGRVHQLGQGVRQPARPHVMDRPDRVARAQLRAAVDHLLRAALDLGIAALDRVEVEVLGVRAGAHRGGRAAAHADAHSRPAQLNQQRFFLEILFHALPGRNISNAAGKHDRLVIAAMDTADRLLEGPEIPGEVGAAELVIERRRADRGLGHDLQRRHDPARPAVVALLPGLQGPGYAQIGHRVANQSGLGLRAAPGGTLVADLAARAGRRARKGGNRGRMVMGFAFDDQMCFFGIFFINRIFIRIKALRNGAFEYRCVVGVGQHGALRIRRMRVPDHAERRMGHFLAVDDPVGVEDLVAAVLGIGLRKHGQLGIGRIAVERPVGGPKIGDLALAHRQAQALVGLVQLLQRHALQPPRRDMPEQLLRLVQRGEDALGHAVVEQRRDARAAVSGIRSAGGNVVRDAALDAPDARQSAVARDIGRFGGPGRDRAQPRHHEKQRRPRMPAPRGCAIAQQPFENASFLDPLLRIGFDEMPELGGDAVDRGMRFLEFG